MKFIRLVVLITVFLASTNLYAADLTKLEKRIQNANEVVSEIMQMPDKGIPADLTDEYFLMIEGAGYSGKDGLEHFKKE